MAEQSANRSIRAPSSVWALVRAESAARGMNVNSWVCMVMTEALGSKGAGAAPATVGPAPGPRQDVAKVANVVRAAEAKQASEGYELSFGRPDAAAGSRLKTRR